MLHIGYYGTSYPDYRLIIGKVPGCEYVQIHNRKETQIRILNRLKRAVPSFGRTEYYAQNSYFTLTPQKTCDIDLIHSFNRICLNSKTPWVATFEKTLPAYFSDIIKLDERLMKRQIQYLLSENCRAILPISHWAYNMEADFFRRFIPEYEKNLLGKMHLIYPPQQIFTNTDKIETKYRNIREKKLQFFYVGSQVKRKGGLEVLKAFDRLNREHYNFQLVFVGNPDAAVTNFYLTPEEKQYVKQLISEADWLEYHQSLPNEEIIRLASESHVGILPTLGDTFGFSVLEMQASGCPVITTNREALSEINNDQCGWILDTKRINLAHDKDYANYLRDEIDALSDVIAVQLYDILCQIKEYPECILKKAKNSVDRIEKYHSPEHYMQKLRDFYQFSFI